MASVPLVFGCNSQSYHGPTKPGGSSRASAIRAVRGDGAEPDALIDSWLLKRFPGKTLDELDTIDWPRHLRAWEAESIERLEERRRQQIAGEIPADSLSADEWERIKAHDALLIEYGPD